MDSLDTNEIAKKYQLRKDIWPLEDKWHRYNHYKISSFIRKNYPGPTSNDKLILNAGSGGQGYGFDESNMYHFDLVDTNIKEKKYFTVGNIESLPYKDQSFDVILCVGEVLNYTDAFRSILEFSRVVKVGGELVLEFESSKTLELLFKPEFNATSTIVDTFFQGKAEKIWYYSEDYILAVLQDFGFEIKKIERFHTLSILVQRLTNSPNFSVKFACLDYLVRYIPWLNGCASNVILKAQKIK